MAYSAMLQRCAVLAFLVMACHCVPDFSALPWFPGLSSPPPIERKCGNASYSPDRQSCCRGNLTDIPENTHAQCCGKVAYWRNETKPTRCTVPGCGSGRRHPETEICCNGRVEWVGPRTVQKTCCGKTIIDSGTHDCCGGTPFLKKESDYKCCGPRDVVTSALYNDVTMECDATSGTVSLKSAQRFRSQELCDLGLMEWDTARSLPHTVHGSHHHIRGWAEKCLTNITTRRGRTHVSISMTPFFTTTPIPTQCENSKTVHVIIKVKKCKVSVDNLQDYLHGVTLDIFFKNNFRCRRGVPTLRLKDKYNAAMLLSKHSNAILARSLGYDTILSNQRNHL